MVEGHNSYCLFNTYVSTIYVTHDFSFLYNRPLWPTYCPTKGSPTAPTFPSSLVLMNAQILSVPAPSEVVTSDSKNKSGSESEDIPPDNSLSQVKPTYLQPSPVSDYTPPATIWACDLISDIAPSNTDSSISKKISFPLKGPKNHHIDLLVLKLD
ncbi:hypothetical protein O181_049849 [Austropuccinia psidii MF-1]|uniref:Uncharacterized protein n=1 Tax=Austropuccinia psidii MF-1 TaxID=1389203 RepID=A0A9Q3DVR2_9BASI|nr:hypothetical protein [Austropuccinia psidii MF-1]